tara:strand:+ start:510 stop:1034 length:525 start_codon:yes stop_codon:yes gene_type:complete
MIITGVGSRQTPEHICQLFRELGVEAREREWWIRSGHAEGADYAFEEGAKDHCIVYLPWDGFNRDKPVLGIGRSQPLRDEVLKIVYKHEAYAKGLSDGVKRIKSRNVYQVLGEDLKSPSDLVVCWTPYGEVEGGTGLAIKIAKAHNIPVINVGDEETEKNFDSILRGIISNAEV